MTKSKKNIVKVSLKKNNKTKKVNNKKYKGGAPPYSLEITFKKKQFIIDYSELVYMFEVHFSELARLKKAYIDTSMVDSVKEIKKISTKFLSDLNGAFPMKGAQNKVMEICDIDIEASKIEIYASLANEFIKKKTGIPDVANSTYREKGELQALISLSDSRFYSTVINDFCK